MEKHKIIEYYKRLLAEIKSEDKIVGTDRVYGAQYVKLEHDSLPKCLLQGTWEDELLVYSLGNKYCRTKVTEEEFNCLLKEAKERIEELKKAQEQRMIDFIEKKF